MKQTITHFILTVLALCLSSAAVAATTDTIAISSLTPVTGEKYKLTKGGLTLEVSKGTVASGYYSVFKSDTLKLSSDVFIKSVEFTCTASGTAKYGPGCFKASTGDYAYSAKVGTWTGSAASITFTASSNQVRMTQIVVTLDASSAKPANLAWSEKNISVIQGVDEFESPTFTKATNAAVTFSSDNPAVATVSTSGEISLKGGIGTAVVTAYSPANELYLEGRATCTITTVMSAKYTLASRIVSGKRYILVAKTDDGCVTAQTASSSAKYGYLPTGRAKSSGDEVIATPGDEIMITGSEGEYTLTDAEGRVLWMSGDYTSFQLGDEGANDVKWSISISVDGIATITNNSKGKSIQYSTAHKSFGSYATDTDIFPYLYTVNSPTTIKSVKTVPADGRKFNILGQPVSEGYKGIVISSGRLTVNK